MCFSEVFSHNTAVGAGILVKIFLFFVLQGLSRFSAVSGIAVFRIIDFKTTEEDKNKTCSTCTIQDHVLLL